MTIKCSFDKRKLDINKKRKNEPGKVNVFVGANGAGKTTILEAIGLLSAAMTDRVDANSLQRKGVRLSASSLYKSNFRDVEKTKLTIDLSLEWEEKGQANRFKYDVHLTTPKDTAVFDRLCNDKGGQIEQEFDFACKGLRFVV